MISSDGKVSVIICAYTMERLQDICEALDSVLHQTLKPHEVIIAVDHNEALLDTLKAKYPAEVKLVLNKGVPGLSDTRNAGIRCSTGNIIAFMDDDATAEKTWLEILLPLFEDANVMTVSGQAVPLWPDKERPKWFPEELDWVVGCTYKGLPLQGNAVRNVLGCNMAFRESVFRQIGLFRTEVGRYGKTQGVGEEAEICLRIRHRLPEARILYEQKAVIHHKVPAWRLSLNYLIRRSYNEGYYKSIVERLSPSSSLPALSTENAYLRYLVLVSIPQRVMRFYRSWALAQMGAIIVSIAATGWGYLKGKLGQK